MVVWFFKELYKTIGTPFKGGSLELYDSLWICTTVLVPDIGNTHPPHYRRPNGGGMEIDLLDSLRVIVAERRNAEFFK